MRLKIAYDADIFILCTKYANTNRGGIYFVGYNIAKLFLDNENIDLYFYTYREEDLEESRYYLNQIFPNYDIKIIHRTSKEWIDINIFYSPYRRPEDFITNNKNIKKIMQIHDLVPVIDNCLAWGNHVFEYLYKDYIYFAVSEYTKNELIKYANGIIRDSNIYTTLLSYDHDRFKKMELNDYIRNKYNIPKNKKYVFSLCGIYPRKNLIRIIRTFHQFIDKHNIKDMLFIMGGYHSESFLETFNEGIKEYKDRILRLGYVDDEDIAYLYSGAEWFIYTSQLEGFGIPPLEAMACGCPVITSNNSSLPEVVGDAGIMIDWNSDEQHIEAYEKYYFDKKYREEMVKKGLERSKLFSWEKCANKMLEVMHANFVKKNINYVKLEDIKYIRLFNYIFTLPKLFSITNSSDNRFIIIKILFIKISIKNKKNK